MSTVQSAQRHIDLVKTLCRPGGEAEWVEYKLNNTHPEEIGQYISALANAAALNNQPFGYLLWGVEDRTGNWLEQILIRAPPKKVTSL